MTLSVGSLFSELLWPPQLLLSERKKNCTIIVLRVHVSSPYPRSLHGWRHLPWNGTPGTMAAGSSCVDLARPFFLSEPWPWPFGLWYLLVLAIAGSGITGGGGRRGREMQLGRCGRRGSGQSTWTRMGSGVRVPPARGLWLARRRWIDARSDGQLGTRHADTGRADVGHDYDWRQ